MLSYILSNHKALPGIWVAPAMLAAALAGCGPHNELVLDHAFAPPSQQHMTLASDWGYTDQKGERRRCLLAFPLPGSHAPDGPRDFLVYLNLPADKGEFEIDPNTPGGAHGFLIQKKGELAGITYFSSGTVRVKSVWFRSEIKKIEIDVVCEDSSAIHGSATVRAAPSELTAFERRYAADLNRLGKPSSQPSDGQAATEPRAGSD